MDLDRVKEIGVCCCCGQPTKQDRHFNMIQLDMDAAWEFPRLGNVFDSSVNNAVAMICDPCGDRFEANDPPTILYAIEFLGEQLVYHDYIPRAHGADQG
ncbi:hypothetical protein [Salmonirosea aquatica]|uniref:Uncharacterized protein n=1 Tax=Salmonirosea aquatica TaxID=2654236 RepID=A0A7C9F5R0_9BACT|nr:hypothetical protein [Cytophagaceae bacterium SJW1-29]